MPKLQSLRRYWYRIRHRVLTINTAVIVVAALIAISWAWGSVERMQHNYNLQRDLDAKRQLQRVTELEVATLEFEQKYYRSAEYHDLEARRRMNVGAPGERVLVLPPAATQADDPDPTARPDTPVRQPSNLEQWLQFLFGNHRPT